MRRGGWLVRAHQLLCLFHGSCQELRCTRIAHDMPVALCCAVFLAHYWTTATDILEWPTNFLKRRLMQWQSSCGRRWCQVQLACAAWTMREALREAGVLHCVVLCFACCWAVLMVVTIHTAGAAAAQHAVVLVLFPEPVAQAQSICANQLLGRKQLQLRYAAAVQLRRRWPSSRAPDESAGATNHNA